MEKLGERGADRHLFLFFVRVVVFTVFLRVCVRVCVRAIVRRLTKVKNWVQSKPNQNFARLQASHAAGQSSVAACTALDVPKPYLTPRKKEEYKK